jgi:hypothetical protein
LRNKISISVILVALFFSCNYIPFPCNFKPNTDNFTIDPIERNDDHFEILRDTVITSDNHLFNNNSNDFALADISYLENKKHGICVYRNFQKDDKTNKEVYSKTYLKRTTNADGNKVVETRKITFTIENLNQVPIDTSPEVVKVKKSIHISIAVTKEQEQS